MNRQLHRRPSRDRLRRRRLAGDRRRNRDHRRRRRHNRSRDGDQRGRAVDRTDTVRSHQNVGAAVTRGNTRQSERSVRRSRDRSAILLPLIGRCRYARRRSRKSHTAARHRRQAGRRLTRKGRGDVHHHQRRKLNREHRIGAVRRTRDVGRRNPVDSGITQRHRGDDVRRASRARDVDPVLLPLQRRHRRTIDGGGESDLGTDHNRGTTVQSQAK